jgi:putative ABC transport system ATP-binding protein
MISELGLSEKKNQEVKNLSFGEAQRVAIARAVINNPKVIFADEPTSALDDSNTEIVMKMIFEHVNKNNSTLVVCTHDDRVKKFFSNAMVIK